ncbi:MAG: hypothetical protein ABIQ95_06110 [Bdellovibrionia bacterium]
MIFKSKLQTTLLGVSQVLSLVIFTFFCTPVYASEGLPIYYSTMQTVKTRQDAFKSEMKKLDLEPVVFGKFKEFMAQVNSEKSKIVIAPSFFGKYDSGYCPVLRFSNAGNKNFKYLILALSDEWKNKDLSSGRIGVVEEVPREKLNDFLLDITGKKFQMVRGVTKPEDLFPLLIFKSADFIMVSSDNLKILKEKFTTPLKLLQETEFVDAPGVFVRKDASTKDLVAKLSQLTPVTSAALGFTSLEPCEGCTQ